MKKNYIRIVAMLLMVFAYTVSFGQSLKAVNGMSLTFTKANDKPVDFKIGVAVSDSTDIRVMVGTDYEISELKVFLIRGKYPIAASTYNSESSEILIEWKDFSNAQPGDRLCIEFRDVKARKERERIPVELDVPIFNIPLY